MFVSAIIIVCAKYQNNFNVFIQYSIMYTIIYELSVLFHHFQYVSARVVEMVELVET